MLPTVRSRIPRISTLFLALCAAGVLPVFAEISLSGEQDGSLETGNYVVNGPITVKRGKTLSFAPGCIVRFKRYSGIVVEGALKCAGTAGLPILFTSENHRVSSASAADAPAPFDWNGIVAVDSQALIDFHYVHVLYSTFGLDVKSSAANIRIVNSVFDENGQFNVRMAGEQLDAKDGITFTYSTVEPEQPSTPPVPAPAAPTVKAEQPAEPPPPAAHEKKGGWKMPVRIGFGALALAGAAGAFYYDSKVRDYQKKYEQFSDRSHPEILRSFADSRDKAGAKRNIGWIGAIIGACGFSITYFF
jgi:hypothetical protein